MFESWQEIFEFIIVTFFIIVTMVGFILGVTGNACDRKFYYFPPTWAGCKIMEKR